MRIIISPAKKMNVDTDSLTWRELPAFLPQTEVLVKTLQGMDYGELKKLWKCNDSIAETNVKRLADMELRSGLTPALLAYEGIQYQHMAPGVFSRQEFDYVLEGHMKVVLGGNEVYLGPGDSLYYDSSIAHAMYAVDADARFIAVVIK